MITILMVSYGTCHDSINTLRVLLESPKVQKILILENNPLKCDDWDPNNSENRKIMDVLIHNKIEVLNSEVNLGFGPGMRKLFSLTTTKYALMVNPDCFVDSEGISLLYEHIANCNCAIVSGALQRPDLTLDAKFPYLIYPFSKSVLVSDRNRSNCFASTYFTGALALVDVSKLLSAGNYSDMFMYFDEVDTMFKLIHAGFKIHSIGEIVGTHARALTTSDSYKTKSIFTAYWSTKNSLLFTRKYLPKYFTFVVLSRLSSGVLLVLSRQHRAAFATFKGIRDSFANRN